MLEAFLSPELLPSTQAVIRIAYGLLLTGTLLFFLPHWRRLFLTSRFGGYGATTKKVLAVQNPVVLPIVMTAWLCSAVLLTLGQWTVPAAALNAAFCWYFFVAMRWSGLHRGFGAPGFMTWWMGISVFLVEFTSHYAPAARSLAILAVQADFAFIMLSAGTYKAIAGYAHNEGMNYGMANPAWSYWPNFFACVKPNHIFLRTANHLGWSVEVIGAVMMLIPGLRFWGGLMILLSFVYVWAQIRLGTLCGIVIACCLFFFTAESWGGYALAAITPMTFTQTAVIAETGTTWLTWLSATVLATYLVLLPLAHAGLFFNFLTKRPLPRLIQSALAAYTNALGIIIWRVFSADHTRFFLRIYAEPRGQRSGEQPGLQRLQKANKEDSDRSLRRDERTQVAETMFVQPPAHRRVINDYQTRVPRFRHVVESITLTCIFTSRRYFASRPEVFEQKLLTYAATLPHSDDEQLVFQYVHMEKAKHSLRFLTESEHIVDVKTGTVSERSLGAQRAIPAPRSVVFEAAGHGSYVAKGG